MRDIYYEELRRNCAGSTKFTIEQMEKVIKSVKNVLVFNQLARKEGLLYLEECCESIDKETDEKYFAELLTLVRRHRSRAGYRICTKQIFWSKSCRARRDYISNLFQRYSYDSGW